MRIERLGELNQLVDAIIGGQYDTAAQMKNSLAEIRAASAALQPNMPKAV